MAHGIETLLGKFIEVQTPVYIYAGKLVAHSASCLMLEDAGVVFETGEFSAKEYKDFQKKKTPIYIPTGAILCFEETHKLA